jgi:hypothetical protein
MRWRRLVKASVTVCEGAGVTRVIAWNGVSGPFGLDTPRVPDGGHEVSMMQKRYPVCPREGADKD